MPETTVEKITRNKGGSIILILFGALMVVIIGFDFYELFHGNNTGVKIFNSVQLIAAFIALLWLALILIVSSMTMSEPSFKKTCPYTVTFFFSTAIEIIRKTRESTGYLFWFWVVVGLVLLVILLLQMLAFSLDPHSNSIFTAFRPFRIEILTVIRLSSQSPSVKQAERTSIV